MIPASVRIFVCTQPVDMRRSFDGLAAIAQQRLGHDPQQGGVFVFVNKRSSHLKVLWFDHNGYCILYKRLHRARFRLPVGDGESVTVDGRALARLLQGANNLSRKYKFDLEEPEAAE